MNTNDDAASTPYKKPPITEAVIALHLSDPIEMKWMDAFARKQKSDFPRMEELIQVTALFNPHGTAETQQSVGKKLISRDNTKVVILMAKQIAISHLAPYTDWHNLYKTAHENWEVLRKIMKRGQVSQVSTRFINRIDIPIEPNGYVDLHKYFNIGLSLPSYAQSLNLQQFNMSCALLHPDGLRFQLQVISAPPVLIDFMSFVIDIDLSTTEAVPSGEDKLWELIGSLRQHKNDLFKSCITPETRKLFQ